MQIINRKKLVWFNNFIWNIYFFTIETVCKFLRSFTVPILGKIEITIDFIIQILNTKFLRSFTILILGKIEITIDFIIQILKNRTVNLFQILLSYSYDDCQQQAL